MIKNLRLNFYKNFSFLYAVYFIIVILFATTLVPIISTSSATTYWSANKETTFAGGSGTSFDPYIITTGGQLYYFVSAKGGYGKLGTTIDLSAHTWDSPTITKSILYLDGDGKSILNLNSDSVYGGFIGKVNNSNSIITLKNLTINVKLNNSTSSASSVGAFVGETNGKIVLDKCVATGTIDGKYKNTGGFVGIITNTIEATDCLNYVNISTTTTNYNVGGIIGYSNSATLNNCGNNGNIIYNNTSIYYGKCGGILGYCNNVTISQCFNTGNINCSYGYAGGLAGALYNSKTFEIKDAYNTGKISGTYAGGLVGYSQSTINLTNIYNSGDVVSQQNITPTKFVDNNSYNIGMNFKGYGETSIPQNANTNGNSIAQPYDTGGSTSYYIQPYITDIEYDKYAADVSLLNQRNKIGKKTNVYSIEPSCLKNNFSKTITFSLNVNRTLEGVSGSSKEVFDVCEFEVPVLTKDIFACNSIIHPPNSQFQGYIDIECDSIYWISESCSTPNEILLSQYIFVKNIFSGNYNNRIDSVHDIILVGARVGNVSSFDQTVYRIVPLLLFRIQMYDDYNNRVWWADYVPIIDYYYCDIEYSVDTETYYSVSQIKSANLGDNFAIDENINGGMPYLKNFYWQK